MNKTKKICLFIFVSVFAVAVIINVFQINRPTVSACENRTLASFPEFTLGSLADGTYFKGIDSFVSDTFIGREMLIDVSQKIEYLRSIGSAVLQDEETVVFLPTEPVKKDTETNENPTGMTEETEQKPENLEIETEKTTANEENDENEKTEEAEQMSENTEIIEEITEEPSDIIEKEENVAELPVTEEPQTESIEKTDGKVIETDIEEVKSEEKTAETDNIEVKTEENQPAPTDVSTVQAAESGDAEFLTDGYFIYKDAFYSIPYLVKVQNERYGKAVAKYAELFPNARVSVVIAPLSSAMIDNEKIRKKITNQELMIDIINSYFPDNINKLNVYTTLYEHRNEYLYYKSDHHWTARGAYYAYAEYSRSIGIEPTPITDMEEVILTDNWKGTAYSMSSDERVKEFSDVVYAYMPTKSHTMTVYTKDGDSYKVKSSIRKGNKSYSAFIDGDNPYTIISVPENPSNLKVLVLKDSYGDAFVPFLTEIFSSIIVADPRYVYFNLYELLKDYPISDIIFMTNIYNPSVKSWVNNVNRIIGQ